MSDDRSPRSSGEPAGDAAGPAVGSGSGGSGGGSGGSGGGSVVEVRRRGDRLALTALVAGAAVALFGLRVPLALATGATLGLAGTLLAVRGERPLPAPSLLAAALTAALAATVAAAAVAAAAEWQIAQQLAEGTPVAWVTTLIRPYDHAVAALRAVAVAAALMFLLGAALTRLPPDSGK